MTLSPRNDRRNPRNRGGTASTLFPQKRSASDMLGVDRDDPPSPPLTSQSAPAGSASGPSRGTSLFHHADIAVFGNQRQTAHVPLATRGVHTAQYSSARNPTSINQVSLAGLPRTMNPYDSLQDDLHSPLNGTFKRLRSSADSDAGSSSCKDMDEPEIFAPDSVPAMIDQLRKFVNYVQSKKSLHHGSASFMRDYLRTMLIQNSISAEEAINAASKAHKAEVVAGRRSPHEFFKHIPDELAKHIFSLLDGVNLARAREVCSKWNDLACEESLWKSLCLSRWRSLDTDPDLWKLINNGEAMEGPNKWRRIYPKVSRTPQWRCRLQKTGRFICNLIAHHIKGNPLGDAGLPGILVVERRFNILHLQRFVLREASVLYFEPEQESDRAGFYDFIEYLNRRTRAGLALEDQRRFIFIPPCDYTRHEVEYEGRSLLGVVQNAYPPLEP